MDNFKVLDLTKSLEWNECLHRFHSDKQDIYFTPEYYSLYEKSGEGKAQCFIYSNRGEIALYPFLLNSLKDLAFTEKKDYFDIQGAYGYNGVCSSTNDLGFVNEFYKHFNQYCLDNNIIAEFTRLHPLLNNSVFSSGNLLQILDRETVFVDLQKTYEEIWNNDYSSKNRNIIRKAQKLGYKNQIVEKPREEDIDKFIEIYYSNMKAVNADKYYYFNREFFINIFNLLKNNIILFNILDNNGSILCSSIFFHKGNYFHYHLSGRNSFADNSVNNFLIDSAITYAQSKGAKFLHIGGGRSREENDSLLKFKKSFSRQTSSFFIGKKIHNEEVYNQVVGDWEKCYPEKKEKYKHFLLKYRY